MRKCRGVFLILNQPRWFAFFPPTIAIRLRHSKKRKNVQVDADILVSAWAVKRRLVLGV